MARTIVGAALTTTTHTGRWRSLAVGCLGLTAYVYVGYPILVALAARFRPAEGPYAEALPPVTLVIAALDERSSITRKLTDVAALDYPADQLQVIVVTDGSTDGTEMAARQIKLPDLTVLHRPERRGKAAAMARGVALARHPIVVFSDANNLYAPDALREVVRPFDDPEVGAVTGAKAVSGGDEEVSAGERAYWLYESFLKRQESRLGCCTAVIGELLAVRRELVPTFPTDLVNDDFFLAMQVARQGWKVAYNPAAVSYEPTAGSMRDDVVRRRRMTAGRWQSLFRAQQYLPVGRPMVLWQVISHKYLRLLLPFAMCAAFASTAGAVLSGRRSGRVHPIDASLFALQAGFCTLAAAGARTPRRAGALRQLALGARYLVRTNYASAEGLHTYCRGRQRLHLWTRVPRS